MYEWVLNEIERGESTEKILLAVMTITANTVLTLTAQPDVPRRITEHYVDRCAEAMKKFAAQALDKEGIYIKGTVAIDRVKGRA